MILSMTGYGSGSLELDEGSVTVETRSVNSRHLKVSIRGPERTEAYEAELRGIVSDRVRRGRVDVSIVVSGTVGEADRWLLDEERVAGHWKAFETLKSRYGLAGNPDLALLVQAGGLLKELDAVPLDWLTVEHVGEALNQALDSLLEMREREGARLESDLRGRLDALWSGVAEIERLAPERLRAERDRLQAAVAGLAGGVTLDEDRLAREIALIADRWNIGEEVVRTRAHLEAFAEYLDLAVDEPVGKRLGFLVQELQREINTMGAKANDTRISKHVVEMKNEIENLREQIENVE